MCGHLEFQNSSVLHVTHQEHTLFLDQNPIFTFSYTEMVDLVETFVCVTVPVGDAGIPVKFGDK